MQRSGGMEGNIVAGWPPGEGRFMRAQIMICLSKMTNEQLSKMLSNYRHVLTSSNDRAPSWLRREIILCVEQELQCRGLSTSIN